MIDHTSPHPITRASRDPGVPNTPVFGAVGWQSVEAG
jgi:hypothetical protein